MQKKNTEVKLNKCTFIDYILSTILLLLILIPYVFVLENKTLRTYYLLFVLYMGICTLYLFYISYFLNVNTIWLKAKYFIDKKNGKTLGVVFLIIGLFLIFLAIYINYFK